MGTGPVTHLEQTNPNQGLTGWNVPIPGVQEVVKVQPETVDREFGPRRRCPAKMNCARTFGSEPEYQAHLQNCPELKREEQEKQRAEAEDRRDERLMQMMAENNRQQMQMMAALVASLTGKEIKIPDAAASTGLGSGGTGEDRPKPKRRGRPPKGVSGNPQSGPA